MDCVVIAAAASRPLAKRMARRLGVPFVRNDIRTFPDGEQKSTLGPVPPADRAIVVHSTGPPTDQNLVSALSAVYGARQACPEVWAVVPYMGYARQDRQFLPGETITMRLVGKLFKAAGASKIFIVDIHSSAALAHLGRAGIGVSAIPALARYAGRLLKNPLVVSPDAGGAARAAEFASILKTAHVTLEKSRDRKTGRVKITSDRVDAVRGRDLILVDDMISTGGSIVKAAGFLKKQGCGRILVACTHGLLVDGAESRIRGAGVERIISTNTIPGETGVVDVSAPLVDAIQADLP